MARKSKKRFFLLDADGYLYSVPRKELKVCDPDLVELDSEVPFVYGSLSLQGKVLLISDKESIISEKMTELKKLKKIKKADSFDAQRPRRSAVKSGLLSTNKLPVMEVVPKQDTPTCSSAKTSNSKKKEIASLQKAAKAYTESLLTDSEPDDDTDSSSITSSNKNTTKLKTSDVAALKALVNSSSSESESTVDLTHDKHEPSKDQLCFTPVVKPDLPRDPLFIEIKEEVTEMHEETLLKEVKKEVDCESTENSLKEPCVEEGSTSGVNFESGKKKVKKSKKSKKAKKTKVVRKVQISSSSESSDDCTSGKTSSKTSIKVVDTEELKSTKRKKHSSTSSSSSSDSSSESELEAPKKKTPKFERNTKVYEGQNYLWKEGDPGVTKVHEKYNVWIQQADLDSIYNSARSVSQFIRCMVDKVYTKAALQSSTAQGFPPRSKGSKKLKKTEVKCRLHPDGRQAILAKAELLENERKNWRPRVGLSKMSQAFAGKITEFHH